MFSPTINAKNNVLVIMSILFYAWGEPENIFLLLVSLLFNYLIARYGLDFKRKETSRKQALIAGLVFNLGVLVFFKYTSPFLQFL